MKASGSRYRPLALGGLLLSLVLGACSGGKDLPVEVRALASESLPALALGPPPSSSYLLGPGDKLTITIVGESDLSGIFLISPSGHLSVPLLEEDVLADGLTIEELREEIQTRLSRYLRDPQVYIALQEVGSQYVFVLGNVRNPQVASVTPLTLSAVLAECGGIDRDGQKKQVIVVRRNPQGDPLVFDIDFKQLLDGKSLLPDLPLQRYDIVIVPKSRVANVRDFMNAAFGNNIVMARFGLELIVFFNALEDKLDVYYSQ